MYLSQIYIYICDKYIYIFVTNIFQNVCASNIYIYICNTNIYIFATNIYICYKYIFNIFVTNIYICHEYIYICDKYIFKCICYKYIYICDQEHAFSLSQIYFFSVWLLNKTKVSHFVFVDCWLV